MNVAIITARAGSKSIKNKNVAPVGGVPLIAHPIRAARNADQVQRIYVSTDGTEIAAVSQQLGCRIIWRPDELAGDDVNHGDVIRHAVHEVERLEPAVQNIVVLLGNTVMIDGGLIDQALHILEIRSDVDSIMSVWEAADDHPLRALEIHDGVLRPYGNATRQASTDRHSYAKAYYFDQGVWVFRKSCVDRQDGPNPWWWMGKRSFPLVREWVTGRDIHSYLDIELAEWWLSTQAHYE